MANLFDAIASAAANIAVQIRDYIDTVALVEKDPTVPAWAKASVKPKYEADEIEFLHPVAKTGSYKDLEDIEELEAKMPDHSTAEYDTGRKWINGEIIYARDFETEISSGSPKPLHDFPLSGVGLAYIRIEGMLEINSSGFGFYGLTPIPASEPVTSTAMMFFYTFANSDGQGTCLTLRSNVYSGKARGTVYYIKA